jgi:hypothetical protein
LPEQGICVQQAELPLPSEVSGGKIVIALAGLTLSAIQVTLKKFLVGPLINRLRIALFAT